MNAHVMSKALVPAGIAYAVMMHLAILKGITDSGHLLLLSVPMFIGGVWLVTRALGAKWRLFAVLALAVILYGLAQANYLRSGMIAADGITHAAMNAFMLWLFGSTLRQGSEPLIARVARHLEGGEISPALASYTRNVTIAWTLFFAAQLMISALLYAFAPLPAWSLFINVLNAPLIGLMFGAEYLIRLWRHPAHAGQPISRVVDAFTRNVADLRNKGR